MSIYRTLEGWEEVALGDAAKQIVGGGTPPRSVAAFYTGTIPWATVKDLNGPYLNGAKEHITPEAVAKSSSRVIPKGNLIVATRMAVGKAFINEVDLAINQDLKAFFPADDVDVTFLLYWFQQEQQKIEGLGKGSTVKGVGLDVLRKLPFLRPPLEQQRKIAAILESVDDAVQKTQAVISQLGTVKRGLMRQLFTRGVPGWHSEFKRIGRWGSVPAFWEVKPLFECAVVQTGLAKGKKYLNREMTTMPYLRVANVQDGYFDLSEIKMIKVAVDEIERYSIQKDDVLLTEGGDADKLGRGHIWRGQIDPCLHQNHLFCVRVERRILAPLFFSYFLASNYAKAYFLNHAKQTTNLASINSTQLKNFPCPLPTLEEQKQIVSVLELSDQQIEAEQAKAKQLLTLKKSLMQGLLSGRMEVTA